MYVQVRVIKVENRTQKMNQNNDRRQTNIGAQRQNISI